MTTAKAPIEGAPQPAPDYTFEWRDIAAALLTSKGIKKGWWRLGIKMRFAALTTQLTEADKIDSLPTALVGIESIAIFATTQGGELVFDAANGFEPVPVGASAPAPRKRVLLRKRP